MISEEIDSLLLKLKDVSKNIQITRDSQVKDKVDCVLAAKMKQIDCAKTKCDDLSSESSSLAKEVEANREQLKCIEDKLKALQDDNNQLKKTSHALSTYCGPTAADVTTMNDIRKKLRTYKSITALRFDFHAPSDIVSGYIHIKKKGGKKCSPTPFLINKSDGNIEDKIWEKIGEASVPEENKENLNIINDFQSVLSFK